MIQRRQFVLSAAALAVAASLPLAAAAESPAKVGFVYVSPIGDAGWTFQHDQGRREMEKALGDKVETRYVESVAEGADAERVIREFAASGSKIVFATSFGYMNYVERVARQFHKVTFLHATGYKSAKNFAPYNARFYEGRYINGVIAGKMTKSNVLGYVGAFPIPEVLQGINAFTLGLRSVRPQATVRLVWLNEWFNPPREREAALVLLDQGADVLAFHSASTAIMTAAEERGQLAIAYHSDMRRVAPRAQLAAVTHHWEAYDLARVRALRDGHWQSGDLWGGVKDGMVRIEGFGPRVPEAVQREVLARQDDIAAGRLHPFAGPVVDSEGGVRVPAGRSASDREILEMDYLVDGVQGTLPR